MAQPVIKGYIDRVGDTGVTTFNMNFKKSYLALGQTTRGWAGISVNSSNGDVYACEVSV